MVNLPRIVELLSGVAGGLVGLLTLAFLLFGPASHYIRGATMCTTVANGTSCTSTGPDHVTTGAIQIDLFPLSIFLLSVVALLFVVLAVSAVLHSRSGHALWQACLWASTGSLVFVVVLTLYALPLALAPALVLATVASGAAWFTARQQTRQDGRRRGVAQAMEVVCGAAAGLLGLAASAYLLSAPNQWMSDTTTCDAPGNCHSMTTSSPSPLLTDPVGTCLDAVVPLAFFGLLAFSALQHSRTGAPVWRACLWGTSLLLIVFSLLGMLTVGLLFLPSAVLALFAAVSTFSQVRTARH